jgi:hypothetical protein
VTRLGQALAALAPWLGHGEAGAAARQALDTLGKMPEAEPSAMNALVQAVEAQLAKVRPEAASQRACWLATAVANALAPPVPLLGLTPLREAGRHSPSRFTEQELVNFLKLPTCKRPARDVILRHLGLQCGRPFANQWEFVAWARQHRPDLDLTSPPVRPSPP